MQGAEKEVQRAALVWMQKAIQAEGRDDAAGELSAQGVPAAQRAATTLQVLEEHQVHSQPREASPEKIGRAHV